MEFSYVYILTNDRKTLLYIGVTSDLERRIIQHKSRLGSDFTTKYSIHNLIYFEVFTDIKNAIEREKQLKNWNRKKKNYLIELQNPNWDFLVYP